MREEVAKKWAAALRSGDYQQGTHYLTRAGQDCCLGVLCKLYGGKTRAREDRVDKSPITVYGQGSEDVLPPSVQRWAGMRSAAGKRGIHSPSLITLNDNGASFAEIADIIDAEWSTL